MSVLVSWHASCLRWIRSWIDESVFHIDAEYVNLLVCISRTISTLKSNLQVEDPSESMCR